MRHFKICTDEKPCLFCKVRAENSPVEGETAARLWEVLSGPWYYGPSDAAVIYRALGYVPFEGYPLKKAFNAFQH